MISRLDELEAKLRRGETVTYDEGADLFDSTLTGKIIMEQNKLTRDDVLELLRAKFPTPEMLTASLRMMLNAFDSMH